MTPPHESRADGPPRVLIVDDDQDLREFLVCALRKDGPLEIEEAGGRVRVVRMRHTADTSFLGLSAARLSGSGIGIGLQAKGTTVIHG